MSEQINKNAPEIRFKGFLGEWEENVLENMASFSKGQGYSKNDLKSTGVPIILYGRLYTRYQSEISEVHSFVDEKKGSVKSKGGEVIVPSSGETSEDIARASAIAKEGIIIGGDLNIIYPHEVLNPYFLALTLSNGKPQQEIAKKAQGKSVVHVRNADLQKIEILFPIKNEQTKISAYFKALDRMIELHQRKHDKLLTLKQAMLQKMFPQPGATTPEIRFKGFVGDWEERKIEELFRVTRGDVLATTKTSAKKTKESPYPVYSSQTKNNGLMGYYKNYLFEDAITWTTDGANAGTVCFREGKFYSTNVNGVLLSDKGYANRAVAEALNREAWRHVSHVGNPKLMNNVMSQIKIFIPKTIEEQQKIGNYFRKFDELISQHATQLAKLKQIKSACLAKMFV